MSILNPFERRSSITPNNYYPFMVQNGSIVPNSLVDATEALKNSDLYAVTSLISSDIAGTRFTGNQVFTSVLNNPSHLTNAFSFWQTAILNLLLNGNVFLAILKGDNSLMKELRLIPSNAITIDLTDDTLTYEVNQFDDYPSAKYNASEMIHVKIMAYGVDTLHNLVGHSPLESLTSEIGQQKEANRLSLSTLKGALNPTSVVKVPQGTLSSEAKDSIRNEFEKANGGNNSGRVMVLDQSDDFSTVSINADVANYLNSMNWGRTQIAKAFGVSDSYLNGTGDQQSSLDQIKDLYVNALNRFIEPLISELRIKCDSSIGVDMSPITDYSNSVFKADILNWVKEGIIEPTEAKTLLESKGII